MPAEPPSSLYLRLHEETWPEHFNEECQYAAAFVVDKDGFFYFTKHKMSGGSDMILVSCCPMDEGDFLDQVVTDHVYDALDMDIRVFDALGAAETCMPLDQPQTYRHCETYYCLASVVSLHRPKFSKKEMAKFGMEIVKLPYEDAVAQYERQVDTPTGALVTEKELPFLKLAKELLDAMEQGQPTHKAKPIETEAFHMPAGAPFESLYLRTPREQWPTDFRETSRYVAAIVVDKEGFFYFTKHEMDRNSIILAPCYPLGEGEIFDEAALNHIQGDLGIEGHVIDELYTVENCKLLDSLSQAHQHCTIDYVIYEVTTTPRFSKKMAKWGMEIVKLPYEDAVAQYERQVDTPTGALVTEQELPFLKLAKQRIDVKPENPEKVVQQEPEKAVQAPIQASRPQPDFTDKVAVVTGGAQGIGKCIAEEFAKRGAHVCVIDLKDNPYCKGDLAKKRDIERFAAKVSKQYGRVDYLINNAAPLMKGITECTYEEFEYAQRVGVTAAFYLSKLFLPLFSQGASIINISSSRDRMSQPETESYTAAKGGIAALTHALAASLAGKVRVNSISPGWIDTAGTVYEGPDAVQQPAGRVGNPMDIASLVLFLCSDQAGFITGENITVDGGMTKLMIYHGDHGWEYHP